MKVCVRLITLWWRYDWWSSWGQVVALWPTVRVNTLIEIDGMAGRPNCLVGRRLGFRSHSVPNKVKGH